MDIDFEKIFIAHLMNRKYKNFIKVVLPFIKPQIFSNNVYKIIVSFTVKYIKEYKKIPSVYLIQNQTNERLVTDLDKEISNNFFAEFKEIYDANLDEQWLIDEAEKFLKEKSLYNAILSAVENIEEKKIEINPEIIQNLQQAIGFSFDKSVGLELTTKEGAEKRYNLYQIKIQHFSTGIPKLDSITHGGFEKKTLSIFLAPTGAGKTNYLVFSGAALLRQGLNVLYVTLEMSEEKIAQRFDANFLQMPINEISNIKKEEYLELVDKKLLNLKNRGRLIIKEYPPVSISAINIAYLLDELKLKENFIPDVLIIDYIGIMKSDRLQKGENSYTMGKAISEEVRGLAVEKQMAVLSAAQTNRTGSTLSDIGLDSISESFGVTFGADFIASLIMTPEMREQNVQLIKVLKNRFGDIINYSIPVNVYFDKAIIEQIDDKDTVKDYTSLNNDKAEQLVNKRIKNEKITTSIELSDIDDISDFDEF